VGVAQQQWIIEVGRNGRRPRYHRGAELDNGTRLDPPQCNVDDAGAEVRWLRELPRNLRRPWAQLCRRCWRGTRVLAAALELEAAQLAQPEVV
jgi:hypothetical protein